MALWTDIIDPATLTGYARKSFDEYESQTTSLNQFLPNQAVNDISVRVVEGSNGLVEAAQFRAYDAELDYGKRTGGTRRTIDLPALGQKLPISEYEQLRLRNAGDTEYLPTIARATDQVVKATADLMEYMRGVVLATGKATIDQPNFKTDDDFGRDESMSVTASVKWNEDTAKVIEDLTNYVDTYVQTNGELPGTLLVSQKVLRVIAGKFSNTTVNNVPIPMTLDMVNSTLAQYQIPEIQVYSRKVRRGGTMVNVLPEDNLFLLPAAGDSGLGKSYWGQTLTASELAWGLAGAERAGIVAGVYKNEQPPVIAEVVADAIGLPILENANLAFTAKVL